MIPVVLATIVIAGSLGAFVGNNNSSNDTLMGMRRSIAGEKTLSADDLIILVVTYKLPWYDAQSYCEMQGGRLGQPSTLRLNKYYEKALKRARIEGVYWIGLNDIKKEGLLRWTDGTKARFKDDWHTGKISNNNDKNDCVFTISVRGGVDFQWKFTQCYRRRKFLCEITGPVQCGTRPLVSERVIGAEPIDSPTIWPWQVSVRRGGNHTCSGAIIGEYWILTSALCIISNADTYLRADMYEVHVGTVSLSESSIHEHVSPVDYIATHSHYDSPWDIALLYIHNPIEYTEFVRPVCLPPLDDANFFDPIGRQCVSVGWAQKSATDTIQVDVLQEAITETTEYGHCNITISDSELCAIESSISNDTCQGDGGGPLVCYMDDSRWYVAGLFNSRPDCDNPATYFNVTAANEWINQTIHTGPDICGRKSVVENRIVGGQDSLLGSWPWEVVISVEGSHNCSGVIIDDHWIMTAARCLYDGETMASPEQFQVIAGMVKKHAYVTMYEKYVTNIDAVHIHNEFSLDKISWNVGLLYTKTPIPFNFYTSRVCLPNADSDDFFAAGTECVITGWGKLNDNAPYSNTLQQADAIIYDTIRCKFLYSLLGIRLTIAEICASYNVVVTGPCEGDVGSSLVCQKNDGLWYLAGIASLITGSCGNALPSVYTRVTATRAWIDQTLQGG
ncbi:transmembrane protease serine 9-like [Saccoglossus kowalevskii]